MTRKKGSQKKKDNQLEYEYKPIRMPVPISACPKCGDKAPTIKYEQNHLLCRSCNITYGKAWILQ